MGKVLNEKQIEQYHDEGFIAPIRVMSEEEALIIKERVEEAEKNLVGRQRWQDAVAITVKDTFYYEGDLNYFFQDPNAEIVAEYTEKDRQFFEAERKAEKSD